MFEPSVKIGREMWRRIEKCAAAAGYSSADEFVRDVLEREVLRLEAADIGDDVRRQLKGLGYLE